MKKKRNISENNEDNSKKLKKLKNNPKATKHEKKIGDNENQNSGLENNSVKKLKQSQVKHLLNIRIERDISYKQDQQFFELFKDSENISLGRNFFITYGSEKEAKLNLNKLLNKSYEGTPLKVKYNIRPSSEAPKQKNLIQIQNNSPKLILANVPLTATSEMVKKCFPNSIKVTKRKKKGGTLKSFCITYEDESQAEEDLNGSQNLEIEGEKVKTFMINNNSNQVKGNNTGTPIPLSPSILKKGKKKRAIEENVSLEGKKDSQKKRKRRQKKAAE